MPQPPPSPRMAAAPRLEGLDIARFLAFAGMVLVNFRVAAGVAGGEDVYSALTNALEGRAAALFVILAGVGLSLSTPDPRRICVRAGVLFAFGMANLVIFDADILHYYALYFLVGLAFLRVPSAWLLGGAAGLVLLALVLLIALDYERGWNWESLTYADLWSLPGFLRHSLYNGWHPVFPWAAFFLFGMWLGRLDLAAARVQRGLILGGAALGMASTGAAWALQPIPEWGELAGLSPIPPGPLYMLAATGSATAVLGALLWATPRLDRAAEPLARTGRQALTLYIAHIYVGMGILEALGRLDGSLSAPVIFWLAIGFVAASVLYAWGWSFITRRGPLEGLLRALTPAR